MEKIFDARGMACPLPVVNAKKICESLGRGDVLIMLADNEIAAQNLMRFAAHKGYEASLERKSEAEFAVRMLVPGEKEAAEDAVAVKEAVEKGLLVVLSSDRMGESDERLGRALMKAFVFALTKQDRLPEFVLCYNSGAKLSCAGSDALEDLKLLEGEGVKIRSCGTCLDFYGLKDKLAVGGVTNMYDIVECMENARKIIKP